VLHEVSDYERSIVQLIVSNLTDERAAAELNVSVRTLRRHLRQLMDRVGARNRCALGAIAASSGWITPPVAVPRLDRAASAVASAHHPAECSSDSSVAPTGSR
jgi:DNA-binding CsgD family transcriptional regulator